MMKNYDLVVVGGGPAGLTAAIYGGRSNLSVLVIEKRDVGSLAMAHSIENYPGFPQEITGKALLENMREQAKRFNVEFLEGTFLGIDIYSTPKIVKTDVENVGAKTVVVALGAGKNSGKKIPGEKEFLGAGVSYCATCDGAFTRNMTVSLFGKGEEIAEEAMFLTRFSKEINIFVTDSELKCSEEQLKLLQENEKVKIYLNAQLKELSGNEYLEKALVSVDGEEKEFETQYAFLYLGTKNMTELLGEFATLDKVGFVVTDETMKTNVEGIYVAGDMVAKKVRQVTTAVNDGTIAGMEAIKYILKNK
ncbi:NAD(P)/FAD-dependent oxidoreductase [Fusobacterium perfoetens]|uniref:NAD(P)/FAD-dependent oxidoreductase n=1 Tax=Fusobacterium perfoetens TaxID=852 RepID=UPI0004871FB3|nr:NAD(P)/FAD-dependent oxidoreductase [Fusobacterium perfoetens]